MRVLRAFQSKVMVLVRQLVYLLGVFLVSSYGTAQVQAIAATQPASAGVVTPKLDSGVSTLRAYSNLEQIPVLVLSPDRERIRHIEPSEFRVSLDSGPAFKPTYVRQEGDDPISLSILVDTTEQHNELLPRLSQAISALVPDYLHAQDHISVYGLDCGLIRTLHDRPANASELNASVNRTLQDWQLRLQEKGKEPRAPCKQSMPLWDSIARVLANMHEQGGRRVLLAVTDGADQGSKAQWIQVLRLAQVESVAVFALTTIPVLRRQKESEFGQPLIMHSPLLQDREDALELICESSGGVEFQANPRVENWRLKDFTQMLRERYIVEYPRGRNRQAGVHSLEISLGMSGLYVRPTGISAPEASEDERKGVHTIPTDPSLAPREGRRKALPSPQ